MATGTYATAQLSGHARKKVAYLMSRFPKLTETFILYEILELERQGLQVEIFPLVRQQEPTMHPEARALVERAHYSNPISRTVLSAQIYWLRKRPVQYVRTLLRTVIGNLRSPKFLARALVVVPQAALFARQMQALGVEHVHAHWATHPTLAAYVVRQLTQLPYSFTAHAHDIYVERAMLEEKIRAASFVVTISEYNRRLLTQLYGAVAADKTVVIHCGIDTTVFQPRPDRERTGPFTIICVGSLQEKKGQRYLIEACAALQAQAIPFRCILVGDGEDRPQIEAAIAQLGLAGQVILMGRQPRNRVSELLAAADVMALPSITTGSGRKEGIPVALMEAMATEIPVVATSISGIPELVEDGRSGLLVPERDSQALAAALLRLYHDPELRWALAAAGRAKVQREFDLRHSTATLYRLLGRDWRAVAAGAVRPEVLGTTVEEQRGTGV